MKDDLPLRGTSNAPSIPAISDYNYLEQNIDGHDLLETNLNIIVLLLS